jgi:hypothetical protein
METKIRITRSAKYDRASFLHRDLDLIEDLSLWE